jgi:hypothetical protein
VCCGSIEEPISLSHANICQEWVVLACGSSSALISLQEKSGVLCVRSTYIMERVSAFSWCSSERDGGVGSLGRGGIAFMYTGICSPQYLFLALQCNKQGKTRTRGGCFVHISSHCEWKNMSSNGQGVSSACALINCDVTSERAVLVHGHKKQLTV